jgi:hypothetical protein
MEGDTTTTTDDSSSEACETVLAEDETGHDETVQGTSDSLVTNNWLGNLGTAILEYLPL